MPSAVIAGTAIYELEDVRLEPISVSTPYGEADLYRAPALGEVFFLPRHGRDHTTPPHRVNYRAHIKALDQLGVKEILAAYAVGSVNPEIPPLSLIALDDIIDFTSGRESTFFEGGPQGVRHVDMSQPFCPDLRQALLSQADEQGVKIRPQGVYVATDGPRLESPAEIAMFRAWGADVVGMTAVPECVLAKELDLCFAGVGFSVNWAAGLEEEVTIVEEGLDKITDQLMDLFLKTLQEREA